MKKKGTTKATTPAKAGPAKANDTTLSPEKRFGDYFRRWQAGAQLAALANEAGVKRSKFRRQLIALAGGKEKFREQRATGAGGKHDASANLRRSSPRTLEARAVDDSSVPMILSAARGDGWRYERLRGDYGTMVHVAPDTTRYVEAKPSERADLIYVHSTRGLPNVRLKKLEESSAHRTAKKAEKTLERGEHALKRTRARKKAARVARKATRSKKEAR